MDAFCRIDCLGWRYFQRQKSNPVWEPIKCPVVLTKRKVIGTIEITDYPGWLAVCVLVHTSASLQNARSIFDRIQRQPAAVLRSLFSFSLPLSPSTLTLSLSLKAPTSSGYPRYPY
jgi:hypothetical protein